jgi:hypothetical protein
MQLKEQLNLTSLDERESLFELFSEVAQTGGTGPGFAKTGDKMRSQDKNSTQIGDGTGH